MNSAQFSITNLRYCPIDLLHDVLSFMKGADLCILWAVGDKKLQANIEKSVESISIKNIDYAPLPRILYRLTHLKELSIESCNQSSLSGFCILDMTRLGSALHSLVVSVDQSSNYPVQWLSCIGTRGLNPLFPTLKVLDWSSTSMEALFSFLPLPSDLTRLSMHIPSQVSYDASYSMISQQFLAQLPIGLREFYFLAHVHFPDDYCPSFPSGLTSLHIHVLEPFNYSGLRYMSAIQHLPLVRLDVSQLDSMDADTFLPSVDPYTQASKVDIWQWIPDTVSDLAADPNPIFVTPLELSRLPSALRRIRIPTMVTLLGPMQIWQQLPRIEEVELGFLEKGQLVGDSDVTVLPKYLKTVHLSHGMTERGIELLPEGVQHIKATSEHAGLAARLPPHLLSFCISGRTQASSCNFEFSYILPSSLTTLDLSQTLKMLPSHAKLPSSLTYLSCWSRFFHKILIQSPERRYDFQLCYSSYIKEARNRDAPLISHAWQDILDLFPSQLKTLKLKTEPITAPDGNGTHLWFWSTTAFMLPLTIEIIKVDVLLENESIQCINSWMSRISTEMPRLHTLSLTVPRKSSEHRRTNLWSFEVQEFPQSLTKLHIAAPISPTFFPALPLRLRSLALEPPVISKLWSIEELQTLPKTLKSLLLTAPTIHLAQIKTRVMEAISLKSNQIDFIWTLEE